MSKLFIFAIGGTGSRVLRSLTMLMASGVKMGVDEVVPIIIDPDVANADLTRTVTLMNDYITIRSSLSFSGGNESQFYKTKLTRILPNFVLKVKDPDDKSFKQFLEYSSMSKANKAMFKMLFSDKNLKSSMEVGFKGNPNVGSIVLNQLVLADDFETFAGSFEEGDKIFIISSIFGGTGASGFPLLLKTLSDGHSFSNYGIINQSVKGAISILPYFRLKPNEESEIDSSTFISKTKSALAYYEKNISSNGLNAFYFLADRTTNIYENYEGGSLQRNDAHLIEFLGATSVVDFTTNNPTFDTNRELGIKDLGDSNAVTFNSFYNRLHEMLYNPLVQFTLFTNSQLDNSNYFCSSSFDANKHFPNLYNEQFYSYLRTFMSNYRTWLEEMKNNTRSLDLFNNKCGSAPFDLVTGKKPRRVISHLSNYNLFADRMNGSAKSCKSKDYHDKFMEMYYLGTKKLIKEKL